MMSNIRSLVLGRAATLSCPRRSAVASVSIAPQNGGAAGPSATPPPANGDWLHIPPNTRSHGSPNRVYSSFANYHLLPSSKSADPNRTTTRSNFSYAGPRKLSDIIKTELLSEKSPAEISDLWMTYHEEKEKVHGLALDKARGKSVLSRAALCPFFIHPVFREEGYFMVISQFQAPSHFLLAFLEDYRMDPSRAQPLLTVSVFDDLADTKDITLVRCDIINQGIEEDEGYKICKCLLEDYANEDDFRNVHMFNKKPDAFDVDGFVKEKEQQWKAGGGGDITPGGEVSARNQQKDDAV